MLNAAEMVALAAVRQALYIFGTVFQSTRDMVHSIADCLYFRCGVGLASARNRRYIIYPDHPQRTI